MLLLAEKEKLNSMYWWDCETPLCPWNVRNPAGELIALTDVTNGTLLHELYRSHAVFASTVTVSFWAVRNEPYLAGSGTG